MVTPDKPTGLSGVGCGGGDLCRSAGSGYHVIKRMPVGGEGGWDYLTVDPDAHRLYVARGSHMMVVDETTGK